MTITQLQYLLALENHKNFVLAAESCGVTQPTLSMQIQKLEQHLGFELLDRSKHPFAFTQMGTLMLAHAKRILAEVKQMEQVAKNTQNIFLSQLRLGIIPTIAPSLLPLFLDKLLGAYPDTHFSVTEQTTENLMDLLRQGKIDFAMMSVPLHQEDLSEQWLYQEPFVAYMSAKHPLYNKTEIYMQDLADIPVLLLQEGHCLRTQVLGVCKPLAGQKFIYDAGNLESLRKVVEVSGGLTFLPELSIYGLKEEEMEAVRYIADNTMHRSIALVSLKNQAARYTANTLVKIIQEALPQKYQA
jgi:LysR family transcriptional regulator, hydrogen peroxide-inducible genes activator